MKGRVVAGVLLVVLSIFFIGPVCADPLPENYEYVKEWGGIGTGPGQFSGDWGPVECTLDDEGFLYVVDYGNSRIQKFTASGDPSTWGEFVQEWYIGYGWALQYYPGDGHLYLGGSPGTIAKFTTDGGMLWKVDVPASSGWQTHGVAVDCEGYIRVCEEYYGYVYKYDRDGNHISTWEGLLSPDLIELDFDGDLWMIEGEGNKTLREFTCEDAPTGRLIDETPDSISALSVDQCGNIYLGLYPSRVIRKYSPNLELLAEWGGLGAGPGEFRHILGIAPQGCGDIVAATDGVDGGIGDGNFRMQVFRRVEVDADGDGVPDGDDNCPDVFNPAQTDNDEDGVGDACDACVDADADGYGSPGSADCSSGDLEDCDDWTCYTYPGATELLDGADNDCDGLVDEDLDLDGDGVPNFYDLCPDTPRGYGVGPDGCVLCAVDEDGDGWGAVDDCDDSDPAVHPGADEVCNETDDDCDGAVDEGFDIDADGFTTCGGDCADNDPAVHPDALELPGNAVDENCDGSLGDCDPNADWRNHGEYVRCVTHEAEDLVASGQLTEEQGDELISSAARSDVGKKD